MSYEVQPEFPPAPQLQVYGDAPEQTSELDEHHDDGAYDVDDQPCVDEDEYLDQATRVRRPKPVVAMAMFSLALVGTTAAFGYRAMISGALPPAVPPIIKATNQPIKIEPASKEPHAKNAADEPSRYSNHRVDRETGLARRAASEDCAAETGLARDLHDSDHNAPRTRSPAWARRPRLRLRSRRRYRAKGCRAAQRRLPILRRRVRANQVQGTSPLHRTARIWPPPKFHLPTPTAAVRR